MKPQHEVRASWYATRTIPMPGEDERGVDSIMIWVEHRGEGGGWAVGRASDLTQREFSAPREHDFIFEGYDIEDALQAANDALEDDVTASELDGLDSRVKPFTRKELEQPLNDWFWGRRAT